MTHRFQYRRYRVPFRVPVRTSHGPWTEREGVLIRLDDGSGGVGYGEAAPIPEFGTETVEEIETVCRSLGEAVDEAVLSDLPVRLGCLRNAVQAARQPKLVAGTKYLAVAALLPAGPAALDVAREKGDAGFRTFKWKVGVGDPGDELTLLDDLCAVLPSGARLRLDANGGWDRRQAERWLERCADRPVEFVEQPCLTEGPAARRAFAAVAAARGASSPDKDMDLLLGLASDYPTPIALDESLIHEGDIERWLGAGWPGVFVIKPSLLGDVAGAIERLARARASVVFSSALETAVGARAALRTAFGWNYPAGNTTPPALGFGVWPLFADRRCDGPHAAPYLRSEDVERIDVAATWNALT